MPKISCVLPVYNAERFLKEAVNSIIKQDFTDFELIVIDDGSTDKSLNILKEAAAEDARVRLFSRPNAGLVSTLNFGISKSQGEYIARMDADDVAHPSRFKIQSEFLDNNPQYVAIGSRVNVINENGSHLRTSKGNYWRSEKYFPSGGITLCHPTTMYRTAAFKKTHGYREEFFAAEDYQLWYEMSDHGLIIELDDVLLNYRIHSSSVSSSKLSAQRFSCLKADLLFFGNLKLAPAADLMAIEQANSLFALSQVLENSSSLPDPQVVDIYYTSQLLRRVSVRSNRLDTVKSLFVLMGKVSVSLMRGHTGRDFPHIYKMSAREIARALVNLARSK